MPTKEDFNFKNYIITAVITAMFTYLGWLGLKMMELSNTMVKVNTKQEMIVETLNRVVDKIEEQEREKKVVYLPQPVNELQKIPQGE